jgi:hypothetical protein
MQTTALERQLVGRNGCGPCAVFGRLFRHESPLGSVWSLSSAGAGGDSGGPCKRRFISSKALVAQSGSGRSGAAGTDRQMPYIIARNVIPHPGSLKVVTSGPVICACTSFLKKRHFVDRHCRGGCLFFAVLGPKFARLGSALDLDHLAGEMRLKL